MLLLLLLLLLLQPLPLPLPLPLPPLLLQRTSSYTVLTMLYSTVHYYDENGD